MIIVIIAWVLLPFVVIDFSLTRHRNMPPITIEYFDKATLTSEFDSRSQQNSSYPTYRTPLNLQTECHLGQHHICPTVVLLSIKRHDSLILPVSFHPLSLGHAETGGEIPSWPTSSSISASRSHPLRDHPASTLVFWTGSMNPASWKESATKRWRWATRQVYYFAHTADPSLQRRSSSRKTRH